MKGNFYHPWRFQIKYIIPNSWGHILQPKPTSVTFREDKVNNVKSPFLGITQDSGI